LATSWPRCDTIAVRGEGRYVTGVRLDGKRLRNSWFTAAGGPHRLTLSLGDRPSWRAAPPPSTSTEPLSAFGCS
jgi:hypothetical protein